MKKKKVAILGTTPHNNLAPYDDESFEIWGLNDLYIQESVKRWDRWFQLHHPAHYGVGEGRQILEAQLAEYSKWECPVYLFEKHPRIPNSVTFPYEKLVKEFGTYFTNTVSWIIAFAIQEGFEEIHLYGIDMAHSTEFGGQRPSCEYFLGVAEGRGIKVHIPEESSLLKSKYLYGCQAEEETAEIRRLRLKMEHVINQHDEAVIAEEKARDVKNQCLGAIQVVEKIIQGM